MPRKRRPARRRGPGQRIVEGASFRLADEVRYIIRRAADQNGRVVTSGQLTLFSSETGDAWIIDRDDRLALRLAKPDVRITRIRLSDKTSRLRPRHVVPKPAQT